MEKTIPTRTNVGRKGYETRTNFVFCRDKKKGSEWQGVECNKQRRGVQDEVQDVGKNSLGNSWALIEFRVYLITMGRVSVESDMIKYNL